MPVPVGLGPREGLPEPYPDPPEVAAVRSMLNRKLRASHRRAGLRRVPELLRQERQHLAQQPAERPSGANWGAGRPKERHVGYILITPETVVETHRTRGGGGRWTTWRTRTTTTWNFL